MLTPKEITATLEAQQDTLAEIIGKLESARDSYCEMLDALNEAEELAGELNIPGAELLKDAIGDVDDDDSIDTAQTIASDLEYLFDSGAMNKLYPRCLGCVNYRGWGQDCVAVMAAKDFDYPCPHYAPMPDGCHCLRCARFQTSACDDRPVACPSAHCCAKYAPANPPAEDPAQGLLNL